MSASGTYRGYLTTDLRENDLWADAVAGTIAFDFAAMDEVEGRDRRSSGRSQVRRPGDEARWKLPKVRAA